MNGLALCSGIGGLEAGLRLAVPSYRTVASVEQDHRARECVPGWYWPDLETFPAREFEGSIDIISAGIPCQPFSSAGQRLGTKDARWLWTPTYNAIRSVQPRLVFMENVPAFAVHGLPTVLRDLAVLGFDAEWGLFSSRTDGAPHLRQRIFLLAAHPDRSREQQPEGADEEVRGWATDGAWWADEPDLARVVHGVPYRTDRYRLLGNAVVPHTAARAFTTLYGRLGQWEC